MKESISNIIWMFPFLLHAIGMPLSPKPMQTKEVTHKKKQYSKRTVQPCLFSIGHNHWLPDSAHSDLVHGATSTNELQNKVFFRTNDQPWAGQVDRLFTYFVILNHFHQIRYFANKYILYWISNVPIKLWIYLLCVHLQYFYFKK